jgi:hypothetical protein
MTPKPHSASVQAWRDFAGFSSRQTKYMTAPTNGRQKKRTPNAPTPAFSVAGVVTGWDDGRGSSNRVPHREQKTAATSFGAPQRGQYTDTAIDSR